jgi:Protein of unknown function (DUF1643)
VTDRHYRYSLWSQWASGGRVLNVIGLNPSTAYDLGGTVRRCIELAKHHGSPRGDPIPHQRRNTIKRRERLGGLLSEYYVEPKAA